MTTTIIITLIGLLLIIGIITICRYKTAEQSLLRRTCARCKKTQNYVCSRIDDKRYCGFCFQVRMREIDKEHIDRLRKVMGR